MATRVFLGLSAAAWLPYGLLCFLEPGFLEGVAGVTSLSPTGSAELRAMYGGLQAALGALCLAGAVRKEFTRTALGGLLFLCAGLGLARLGGAALDGDVTTYTAGAIFFELACAALAAYLLTRAPQPTAA